MNRNRYGWMCIGLAMLALALFPAGARALDQEQKEDSRMRRWRERRMEQNLRALTRAQQELAETYGSDWQQKAAADPAHTDGVKTQLRDEFGPWWYTHLDQAIDNDRDGRLLAELDERYGDDWRVATADALDYYNRTIYCVSEEDCGGEAYSQQRGRILLDKQRTEVEYGHWYEIPTDELDAIEKQLEDEYGRTYVARLRWIATKRPPEEMAEMNDRFGPDWPAVLGRAEIRTKMGTNKGIGYETVLTEAEQKAIEAGQWYRADAGAYGGNPSKRDSLG